MEGESEGPDILGPEATLGTGPCGGLSRAGAPYPCLYMGVACFSQGTGLRRTGESALPEGEQVKARGGEPERAPRPGRSQGRQSPLAPVRG